MDALLINLFMIVGALTSVFPELWTPIETRRRRISHMKRKYFHIVSHIDLTDLYYAAHTLISQEISTAWFSRKFPKLFIWIGFIDIMSPIDVNHLSGSFKSNHQSLLGSWHEMLYPFPPNCYTHNLWPTSWTYRLANSSHLGQMLVWPTFLSID